MSDDLVKWNPELNEEGKAYAESLRGRFYPVFEMNKRIKEHLGIPELSITDFGEKHSIFQADEPFISLHHIDRMIQNSGAEIVFVLRDKDGKELDLKNILLNRNS